MYKFVLTESVKTILLVQPSGLNFINVLRTAYTHVDLECAKMTVKSAASFGLPSYVQHIWLLNLIYIVNIEATELNKNAQLPHYRPKKKSVIFFYLFWKLFSGLIHCFVNVSS